MAFSSATPPSAMAAASLVSWPEPPVSVQAIVEGGIRCVPDRYVRPFAERAAAEGDVVSETTEDLPLVDLSELWEPSTRSSAVEKIRTACVEWGFLQLVNHGIPAQLLQDVKEAALEYFKQPTEQKMKQLNDPVTYVGFGCRLGLDDSRVLDWGDYFYHHYTPLSLRQEHKWPSHPPRYREVMKKYCAETERVAETLLEAMGEGLGLNLRKGRLVEAMGGEMEGSVRLNYYPPCPQPDLALGLSPHSDPGALTFLLQTSDGLQVRHPTSSSWVSLRCSCYAKDALIINVGDQTEIVTGGRYRSVEHRVMAPPAKNNSSRLSVVVFWSPVGEHLLQPLPELDEQHDDDDSKLRRRVQYPAMTYNEYRKFIRTGGARGKDYLRSLISSSPKL